MLNLRGRRCLIVGAGSVAARRARAMFEAGARVCVVAPRVDDAVRALGVELRERGYEPADMAGAFLVVVATDDARINERVAADARAAGVLVNRADDPEAGDFVVPAHGSAGPVTVAVHSGGVSAAAAAAIRDELLAALDPAWPRLLSLAAPYRGRIQAAFTDADERQARLRKLTDGAAAAILKGSGEDAYRRHCEALAMPG